jgi:molecular chaperone HscB
MRRGHVAVVNHSMSKRDQNPFELLGFDPGFDLDLTALDQAYFKRQSVVHPDRFVYHSEPERLAASAQSSALNGAYETLKNPLLRAKVLLEIRGIDIGDEEGKTIQDIQLLEEMMDLQEALLASSMPNEFLKVETDIQTRLQEITTAFVHALGSDNQQDIKKCFLRFSYLSKLMEDIKVRRLQSSIKIL